MQRDLSVDDVFDLVEVIEVETAIEKAQGQDQEIAQRNSQRRG